jgi:predicted nucleic acid-binding protein
LILADTSVWIDHLRSGDNNMRERLNRGEIAMHPFVIAELALGSLKQRRKTLALLDLLPQVPVAQLSEVRLVTEARGLHGLGIGLIDACLLASVFLDPSLLLWTRDKNLRRVAGNLGVHVSLA